MAGGGLPDIFGALGSGLSSLAGAGSGGAVGGGSPNILPQEQPQNAASNVLTDPLVASQAAVSGGDPSITGQQPQQQAPPQPPPQPPTFTPPPQAQQPQPVPQASQDWLDTATDPNKAAQAAVADPNQAAQADPNQAQPITAQAGPAPAQANVGTATPPPETAASATDQQGAGAGQQRGQQRQQNPLTQASNFFKNLAKPGSAPHGIPNLLGDLLRGGPAAVMQDLMGLTNQVGPAYGQQEYGSQGATEHGYGYGAAPSSAQAAVPPLAQQQAAPQPPATDREARAAEAERNVQAELAAQAAQRDPSAAARSAGAAGTPTAPPTQTGAPAATVPPPAARPPATPASLTTGTTGTGHAASPIAQGEIQISPYSRAGAPPMKPSQGSVDVSPLGGEVSNPNTVRQMAQMVSQEVGLKPGNTRAQIIQLETLRNRALYGIQGNGRFPDRTRAPTSLAQAGQTLRGPYSRAGYSGYYPDYSNQRVSPAQQAAFKRDVYDVVFPPDGGPGSNLSDVGWGPMTGNASNDPRMGEKGMVAKHQYLRGTQGYSMRRSGGDDYFREHVRSGDSLPQAGQTMTAVEPQRLYGEFNFGPRPDLEGIVNTTAQAAPGGLPTQDWRRSTNVEEGRGNPFMTPLAFPTGQTGVDPAVRNDWMAGLQSPQRNTEMARQLGINDIEPLLDQLVQQWAMQTMGGPVPMPRPRPR
jgi:hypothetical protein